MRLKYFLCVFFLFSFFFLNAKPPTLTPRDTRVKIEEILKAHVCHQQLNSELVARAMENFAEELDPGKTYFLESDLKTWINPSDDLLAQTLQEYKKEEFTVFEEIHAKMILAIERRNLIEKKIEKAELPKDVQPSEFKDIKWAKTEGELSDRLLRIKSLQLQTAEKITPEIKDQFIQRLTKRRLNREGELMASSGLERKQLTLAYVLKATSSALDSQTIYFTPAEANQFMIQVQQRLFGIGAQLRDDLSGFTIVRLVDGGPGSQGNKLKVGDRIVAVNGEPIVGMDIFEAVEQIRGPQGSTVLLTVLREVKDGEQVKEEKHEIEIVREEVVLKESRYEASYEPYGDGAIAVLQLFSFYQDAKSSSANDLAIALNELKKDRKIKGVVLDLRNNAGGVLPQAVSVTGLFIDKGVVVSIKDNTGQVHHLRNIDGKKIWDGPLFVLTSRGSASAAEIVAQTLQDYGRAIVVGDPETFGKGTFQTFTLETAQFGKVNPKGEYKVTRGRYYTVSGKSPQLVGVKAQIVVPGILSEMEIGEKYAKFPVATDQIASNFQDDFTDIPAIHRHQISRIYQDSHQEVVSLYQPYLEQLKTNSSVRVAQNKNYQNLLKEIAKKDAPIDHTEFFGQNDLQLNETINVMKDLILLMDLNQIKAKAPEAA
jgi:carboxyl-terminal processing protease